MGLASWSPWDVPRRSQQGFHERSQQALYGLLVRSCLLHERCTAPRPARAPEGSAVQGVQFGFIYGQANF